MRFETDHLSTDYMNNTAMPMTRHTIAEHLRHTCIKLNDGELLRDAKLCWTSAYLLPEFVRSGTVQ